MSSLMPLIRGSNLPLPEPRGSRLAGYARFCATIDATRRGSGCGWAAPAPEPGCAAIRLDWSAQPDVYLLPLSAGLRRAHQPRFCLLRFCTGDASSGRTTPMQTGIRNRTLDTDGHAVRLDLGSHWPMTELAWRAGRRYTSLQQISLSRCPTICFSFIVRFLTIRRLDSDPEMSI